MSAISKTILVVEDEKFFLDTLKDKLKESGFVVTEAADGNEGLQAALKTHPDLILVDIVLPQMDGLSVVRELRKDMWGKDAKVIFLTNYPFGEKAGEALNLGVTEYITKANWTLDQIVGKVKEKLEVFGKAYV
ncbi:MAG TPA: response regulator [Candidatus Saccharimonadales bacterium]|nr:response regulator [Candidatus Saccharimonadales bacterium]